MANRGEQQEGANVNDMAREFEEARQILHDSGASPAAVALVDSEIKRIRCGNRPRTQFNNEGGDFMDIYNDGRVKLVVRCSLPTEEFPKYNFLGKLLGPGGSTMKQLQEETMTKISILGRGSMRDKSKEEEMRNSGEVKYAHLNEQLHIEIIANASPAEAHARVAFALTELKKYITPEEESGYGDMMGHPMMGPGGPGPLMGMMGGPMGPPGRGRGRGRGGFGDPSTGRTMDFLEKARMSASGEDKMGEYGGFDQYGPHGGYDAPYNGSGGWTASPGRGRGGPGAPRGAAGARGAPRGAPRGRGGFGDQSRGAGKAPRGTRGGRPAPY